MRSQSDHYQRIMVDPSKTALLIRYNSLKKPSILMQAMIEIISLDVRIIDLIIEIYIWSKLMVYLAEPYILACGVSIISIVTFILAGIFYKQSCWSLQLLQLVAILPTLSTSYDTFSSYLMVTHCYGSNYSLRACIQAGHCPWYLFIIIILLELPAIIILRVQSCKDSQVANNHSQQQQPSHVKCRKPQVEGDRGNQKNDSKDNQTNDSKGKRIGLNDNLWIIFIGLIRFVQLPVLTLSLAYLFHSSQKSIDEASSIAIACCGFITVIASIVLPYYIEECSPGIREHKKKDNIKGNVTDENSFQAIVNKIPLETITSFIVFLSGILCFCIAIQNLPNFLYTIVASVFVLGWILYWHRMGDEHRAFRMLLFAIESTLFLIGVSLSAVKTDWYYGDRHDAELSLAFLILEQIFLGFANSYDLYKSGCRCCSDNSQPKQNANQLSQIDMAGIKPKIKDPSQSMHKQIQMPTEDNPQSKDQLKYQNSPQYQTPKKQPKMSSQEDIQKTNKIATHDPNNKEEIKIKKDPTPNFESKRHLQMRSTVGNFRNKQQREIEQDDLSDLAQN